MAPEAYTFDQRTAMRIARMLREWEGRPKNFNLAVQPTIKQGQRAFWLAQSTSLVKAGATAGTDFKIFSGTTFWSESASSYTGITAYVRRGIVYANVTYILMEINGFLEVMNPTLSGIGKTSGAITKGTSGTVKIYAGTTIGSESDTGQTLTAWNRYADAATTKWCRWAWNDDSKAFDLTALEC